MRTPSWRSIPHSRRRTAAASAISSLWTFRRAGSSACRLRATPSRRYPTVDDRGHGHKSPRNGTGQLMVPTRIDPALDDAALLRDARSDHDAFCLFYVRHVRPLSAWIRAQVRDAETADELVAESF